MEGQKRLQGLFIALKEKYKESESMLGKKKNRGKKNQTCWVGKAQTNEKIKPDNVGA